MSRKSTSWTDLQRAIGSWEDCGAAWWKDTCECYFEREQLVKVNGTYRYQEKSGQCDNLGGTAVKSVPFIGADFCILW